MKIHFKLAFVLRLICPPYLAFAAGHTYNRHLKTFVFTQNGLIAYPLSGVASEFRNLLCTYSESTPLTMSLEQHFDFVMVSLLKKKLVVGIWNLCWEQSSSETSYGREGQLSDSFQDHKKTWNQHCTNMNITRHVHQFFRSNQSQAFYR